MEEVEGKQETGRKPKKWVGAGGGAPEPRRVGEGQGGAAGRLNEKAVVVGEARAGAHLRSVKPQGGEAGARL